MKSAAVDIYVHVIQYLCACFPQGHNVRFLVFINFSFSFPFMHIRVCYSPKISGAKEHFWPGLCKPHQYDFQNEACTSNHRQVITSLLSLLWKVIPVLKLGPKDHCFLDY